MIIKIGEVDILKMEKMERNKKGLVWTLSFWNFVVFFR